MKDTIVSRKRMYGLCAELSDDDGMGPRGRSRSATGVRPPQGRSRPGLDRKALQLCHQVAETLEEVLAECGDSVLQDLRVLDVEPAPDASRLLVTLAVDQWQSQPVDPSRIHDHLSKASGHLRSEVAGAITRKRTPVLVYRLAAPEW
ncbi:MAG: ribosome-binding factor A [Isosphaeraceae bacterium]